MIWPRRKRTSQVQRTRSVPSGHRDRPLLNRHSLVWALTRPDGVEISSTEQRPSFCPHAIVHLHLENPETTVQSDHCPSQMVATRLTLLEKPREKKPCIHLFISAFPGLGACSTEGRSVEWQPIPATRASAVDTFGAGGLAISEVPRPTLHVNQLRLPTS